jgi:predicted PhzF superfamily epimerase YddE/YHI9
MNRRFQIVDVFNDRPYSGNPLAVVNAFRGSSNVGELSRMAVLRG